MKRNIFILVVLLSACNLSTPNNDSIAPTATASPIPATPTITPTATEDITVKQLETAQAELVNANLTITVQADRIKELQTKVRQANVTKTPAIAPTSAVPGNVVSATALQRVNLRRIKEYNKAGNPFMVIYQPRIQYSTGESIQIYLGVIIGDGAIKFYEVYGPRGGGLFVRAKDISLP